MEIVNTLLLIALLVVIYLDRKPRKESEKVKLTKEQKKKLEEAKQSFENLMKYDEDIAMKRK